MFFQFSASLQWNKKFFVYYYGIKGHGKGLVDAMSGFGLKTPLRKAIVTENVFYDSAQKVYEFISYGADVLHWLASHPIFSYWVG